MKLAHLQHHINHNQKAKALEFLRTGHINAAIGHLTRVLDKDPTGCQQPAFQSPHVDHIEQALHSDVAFNRWFFSASQEAYQVVFNDASSSTLSKDFMTLLQLTPDEARLFEDIPNTVSRKPQRMALIQAYILGFFSSPMLLQYADKCADEMGKANEEHQIEPDELLSLSLENHPHWRHAIVSQRLMHYAQNLSNMSTPSFLNSSIEKANALFEQLQMSQWHSNTSRQTHRPRLESIISHIPEFHWIGQHRRTTRNLDGKVRAYAIHRLSMNDTDRITAINKINELINRRLNSDKYQNATQNDTAEKKKQLLFLNDLFSYEKNSLLTLPTNQPVEIEQMQKPCQHSSVTKKILPKKTSQPRIKSYRLPDTTPPSTRRRTWKTAFVASLPMVTSIAFLSHHHPRFAIVTLGGAFLTRSALRAHTAFSYRRRKKQRSNDQRLHLKK